MPMRWDAFLQVILAIAGGIVTLIGAGSAIFKLFDPYKRVIKRLDECEKTLVRHGELFQNDLKRFERNEEKDIVMFDAIFALLEHARTNNSTGLMDAASKKMQAFLIKQK